MTKTWDEFIARQVEATLKGERIHSEMWRRHPIESEIVEELRLANCGKGMVWLYIFGNWGSLADYWFVNHTEHRVLHVHKSS